MSRGNTALSAAPSIPVPMLDVSRQNHSLNDAIEAAIADVCHTGAFVHGPACARLEAAIADYCGTKHAIGCASGSDALLLALMLYDIGPGDEVIVPSFTFFATAGCVWRLGAKPVFADILPGTFNIDPADIERKLTPATKAIMPVHLFGQCARMDRIHEIAAQRGIPVIEDACQAIGAEFQGRRAGALGALGALSFYPTKNLGGFGDGGMITTDDDELAARLRVLRDHGQQPRYYHHVVGLNSRLDSLQAAVLSVKLPKLDQWAAARERNAARYERMFGQRGLGETVAWPRADEGCRCVWNQYTVRVLGGRRDALQRHLAERKIGSAIYYPVPLHLQKCFASLGYGEGSLPESERAAHEVLSLPVFPELTAPEQNAVIDAVEQFCLDQAAGSSRAVA